MTGLIRNLKNWVQDECGATAIEYALIASAISLGLVPLLGSISTRLEANYSSIAGYLNTMNGG